LALCDYPERLFEWAEKPVKKEKDGEHKGKGLKRIKNIAGKT